MFRIFLSLPTFSLSSLVINGDKQLLIPALLIKNGLYETRDSFQLDILLRTICYFFQFPLFFTVTTAPLTYPPGNAVTVIIILLLSFFSSSPSASS